MEMGSDGAGLVVGLWLQRIGVDTVTVIIVLRLQCIASVWGLWMWHWQVREVALATCRQPRLRTALDCVHQERGATAERRRRSARATATGGKPATGTSSETRTKLFLDELLPLSNTFTLLSPAGTSVSVVELKGAASTT